MKGFMMNNECDFCHARMMLSMIMFIVENCIPEFDVDLYDDPITAVFNAADDAISTLECYCGVEKEMTT